MSVVIDKAEQFVRAYERNPGAMPDEKLVSMLQEVQVAQATYARDRDQFLPTKE